MVNTFFGKLILKYKILLQFFTRFYQNYITFFNILVFTLSIQILPCTIYTFIILYNKYNYFIIRKTSLKFPIVSIKFTCPAKLQNPPRLTDACIYIEEDIQVVVPHT